MKVALDTPVCGRYARALVLPDVRAVRGMGTGHGWRVQQPTEVPSKACLSQQWHPWGHSKGKECTFWKGRERIGGRGQRELRV